MASQPNHASARWRVLAFFSLGFLVSYVFRGVNLGFAPYLTRELGLTAGDLGLLTSFYFLGLPAPSCRLASCSTASARAAPRPSC
jgi:sugar phosphate permease